MIENEAYGATPNTSSPSFPSSGDTDTTLNATIDTNDSAQGKQKSIPHFIPKSLSSLATETDNILMEKIIQISDDDELQTAKEISAVDGHRKISNDIIRPGLPSSSDNNGVIQDLELSESLPPNEKSTHGNIIEITTSTPTSDSVAAITSLHSPLLTSALSPPITSLSSASSSPAAPSPTSELAKHHRHSSPTKSAPTIDYRRTRTRTHSESRSLSPSSIRQVKKIVRLSVPNPLPSSPATQATKIIRFLTPPSMASPKLTPPPPRILRHLLPTGYIYDVFMSYHATLDTFDIHPEDPRRIFFIYREMMSQKLLDHCERIPIRKATKQDILAVHELDLLKALVKTKEMSRKELMNMEENNDSIYVNNHSYEASLYAAGGVMELCKAVLQDKIKNGFAIVRPPGHHAESDVSMGFCFINNVAIATQYCLQQLNLKKIMIVDWDVHFGNGTHQIFARNPNVLYLSIHRYNDGSFYPGYDNGGIDHVGDNPAEGLSVNIPWANEGATDDDYMYAFHQIVMPIGYEFQPDLLIVSAGFDAADGDDIGMCKVSPAGFSNMTHLLKSLANGRMVMALEGGYNLKATSISATACMSVLMGEAPLPLNIGMPSKDAASTVDQVKVIQSKYWRTLRK